MARKKNKGMTESELAQLCHREFDNSVLYQHEIESERADSLDAYNSEPYGNEESGLSAFVTSDVRDAIEWALPQLVDIFVGGDTPVEFMAENDEDTKDAETESRAVQYVFERQNKGALITYSWLKDALIQKNGVVKAFWDLKVNEEREEYLNKSYEEYLALMQDEDFEIDECTICIDDHEFSEKEFAEVIDALSSSPESQKNIIAEAEFNCVGFRSSKVSQAKVVNVPPENFFVQRGYNSIMLKDVPYCCEIYKKTRSDLIVDGYDRDLVDALPTGNELIAQNAQEKDARFRKEGGFFAFSTGNTDGDPSRDEIVIFDHYIRADYNGDGVAELRLIRTAGSKENVLENKEVDRVIYHAITPYLNTHKFMGRSMADNLMDLQKCKTQLWRNMFDNYAYSAIPRKIISGTVNTTDLLTFIQGGIIRKNADATIENDTIPFVAGDAMPLLDRLDMLRSERTGFSKESMGLDPSALANSTNVVGMAILAQSQLLIKMIATLIAQTGFEDLMLHLRELIRKNERQDIIYNLTGEFLQTNPRDWRNQRKTDIKVGIGYAGKQEEIATVQSLLTLQQELIAVQQGFTGPMTNPTTIYNTIKRLCQRMGIKNVSNYFQDPATYQAPPPPGPSLAEVGLKANIDKQNADVNSTASKTALDTQKFHADTVIKQQEMAQNKALEMARIASQEKMFELELLYKYGKDAHDRAIETLGSVSAMISAKDKKDEQNEPHEQDDTAPKSKPKRSNPKK